MADVTMVEGLLHIKDGDGSAVAVHPETCAAHVKETGGKLSNQADENAVFWAAITRDESGLSEEVKREIHAAGVRPKYAMRTSVLHYECLASEESMTIEDARQEMLESEPFRRLLPGGLCFCTIDHDPSDFGIE